MTKIDVSKLPMQPNDAEAATVGEYLCKLLELVWIEGEGFSGKRPFGNSGWKYEVYPALIKSGLVSGKLDDEGYVATLDKEAADKIILAAINEAFGFEPD